MGEVSDTTRITGDAVLTLSESQWTFFPSGTQHRLVNPGIAPLQPIIKVQWWDFFGEDDIVRFEDWYDRQ